jgi:hypothetical protein
MKAMRVTLAALIGLALVLSATGATAAPMWKRCALHLDASPTLSVRGMTCADGLSAQRRLADENPGVQTASRSESSGAFGPLDGRGAKRRLTCSVRYDPGTGPPAAASSCRFVAGTFATTV